MKIRFSLALVMLFIFGSTTNDRAQGLRSTPIKPINVGETFDIHSKRLKEEREIRVYLPQDYTRSNQRYPVIYTLDGETMGQIAASSVQFLTEGPELPQMPEALVVAISNTDRNRDMPIPQGYGKGGEESFLDFLADELLPTIESKYRTEPLTVIVGHSQGGTFIHYALAARPKVFQWYLSLDAPLFGPVRPILENARVEITNNKSYRRRFVSVEGTFGWGKDWDELTAAAPKEFFGSRIAITDETHETIVYKGIYEGLRRLFHDYPPDKKDANLAELQTKYSSVGEAYGYSVKIPRRVLLNSARRNILLQNGVEAMKLLGREVELYGKSDTAGRLLIQAQEASKSSGPDARVAELLKVPAFDPSRLKPFLGTWSGTLKMPDGDTLAVRLELLVEAGISLARLTVTPPGSSPYKMESDFMREPKPGSLQWGFRNRGGGLIVETVAFVETDFLKGTEEAVGVPMPAGMKSPAAAILSLRRAP